MVDGSASTIGRGARPWPWRFGAEVRNHQVGLSRQPQVVNRGAAVDGGVFARESVCLVEQGRSAALATLDFDDVGFAGTDLDQLAGHTDADRTRPTRGRGDAHLPIGEP